MRLDALASPYDRDATMKAAAERVIWGIMGFGRVPDDFESWAPAVSERVLGSEKGQALLEELRAVGTRDRECDTIDGDAGGIPGTVKPK